MGELRASLYDIFGYLIPGIVAFCSLRLFSWVILYPESNLSIELLEKPLAAILLAITSYILGHLVHAIGNWLNITKSASYGKQTAEQKKQDLTVFDGMRVSNSIIDVADLELRKHFGDESDKLDYSEKLTLIDEFRVTGEKENEREVYIYREGFYRGMVISTLMFLLALIASMLVGDLILEYDKFLISLQRSERLFYIFPTLVAIVGFWMRMMRFSHYRISRAVAHFLVLSQTKQKKHG